MGKNISLLLFEIIKLFFNLSEFYMCLNDKLPILLDIEFQDSKKNYF